MNNEKANFTPEANSELDEVAKKKKNRQRGAKVRQAESGGDEKETEDTKLSEIDLSPRVYLALERHNHILANGGYGDFRSELYPSSPLKTIDDILNIDRNKLARIRNLGVKGFVELEDKIRENGHPDFTLFSKYNRPPFNKRPEQKD